MQMVWHRQIQTTDHVSAGFADGEGFRNGLLGFGRGKLVGVARNAADRGEIDLAFRRS